MIQNDLEFRISQYLDGTLPARETRELEQRLTTDLAARALLEEYRQVDALLKSVPPVPAVDYDQLSARISDAVAAVDAEPEVLYSFKWVKRVVGVAVAACVTVGFGVWMHGSMGGANRAVVQVELPRAEMAEAPAVAEISIGPSTQARSLITIEEAIVTKPTKLVIASASPAGQDNASPY
jgi:anti-sigma factor RsiW